MRDRIALPPPSPRPGRPGFPLIAVIAPIGVAAALWAITGMAMMLLFAVMSPVIALASVLDGVRQRRRAARRAAADYLRALTAVEDRVRAAVEAEREQWREAPDPRDPLGAADIAAMWRAEAEPTLVLGIADLASGIEVPEAPDGIDADAAAEIARLRELAAWVPHAACRVSARGGVGIIGTRTGARAVARELALQLAGQLSPASTSILAPAGEEWAAALPHRVEAAEGDRWVAIAPGASGRPERWVVCWAEDAARLCEPVSVLLAIGSDGEPALLRGSDVAARSIRPRACSRAEAASRAVALGAIARQKGIRAESSRLPDRIAFADLSGLAAPDGGLAVAIGHDGERPVIVDLRRDGPHALVAGTTGSGKSELLLTWVLALAASQSPDDLSFLLVDYKGGATFAALAGIPHVAGVLSDLTARRSRRALQGLTAELRRREAVLAAAGVRSIEDLAPGALARLVVVVDEFAALIAETPELHDVVADIAARGRSLGIHLILCTQRPSGVVRDAILANVTLRLALRVLDRSDSVVVVGSDDAAHLPAVAGRAILANGTGRRRIQVAVADHGDVERVRERFAEWTRTPQPWTDELPTRIRRGDLSSADGAAFGLLDLPEEQRHAPAIVDPHREAVLLITGAPGSGKSTALATLTELTPGAVVIPPSPADAWSVVSDLIDEVDAGTAPQLLAIDDLDRMLARAGNAMPGFVERLDRLLRCAPARGTVVAMSATAASHTHGLHRLASAHLALRQSSRDEHLLAGLDARDYDPDAPPGRGSWRGRTIQVIASSRPAADVLASAARPASVPPYLPGSGAVGIVTSQPQVDAARWSRTGVKVLRVGDSRAAQGDVLALARGSAGPRAHATVLIGDADAWQTDWGLLTAIRRAGELLLDARTSPAEFRSLTRVREEPPPLGETTADGTEEWWHVADGRCRRVRLWLPRAGARDRAAGS